MVFVFLIIWIACGVGGYHLGKEKTIGAEGGAALALVLGLLGLIIILCLPARRPDYEFELNNGYEPVQDQPVAKQAAVDELDRWFELKQKGAITEDEFQAKKQELL